MLEGETTGTIHFPAWFSYGLLGALACCIAAIVIVVLYKKKRRAPGQGQQNTTKPTAQALPGRVLPPRRQPGTPAPFVYSADKPWGWLVYRNGNFTGQELALKRAIISIGREEDNEVWLDDYTISRYHAELAWDQGQVYVTDNDSLNGVLINGQRIRTSQLLKPNDELEIGGHRFILKHAQPQAQEDLSDPLLPQIRRIAQHRSSPGDVFTGLDAGSRPPAKPTVALGQTGERSPQSAPSLLQASSGTPAFGSGSIPLFQKTPAPERPPGLCIIRIGGMSGYSFLLDRSQLTLGCGPESDLVIPEASIARVHLQFSRLPEGDYVRDQGSPTGSYVNGQRLQAPRLLYAGDIIALGGLQLEYRQRVETPPPSTSQAAQPDGPLTLPFALRLPSRMKDQ